MQRLAPRFVGSTLLSIVPDGMIPVPWTTLREAAQRLGFLALIDKLSFGSPESVCRSGRHFTARASGPATKMESGVRISSQATVTFDLQFGDDKLRVYNITGVRAKPWIFKEFPLVDVTFTIDDDNNVYATTDAWGWFPWRVRISANGIEKA